VFALVVSALAIGCDANKHMEYIGFKQGENVVEKGTIKYDTLVDKDEACMAAWGDYEANSPSTNGSSACCCGSGFCCSYDSGLSSDSSSYDSGSSDSGSSDSGGGSSSDW
jgi:hypothetical protein